MTNETLDLFPRAVEPPLLALLRRLCAGVGCHPCPSGLTVEYLAFAANREREDVTDELNRLWHEDRVDLEIDEDGVALWAPSGEVTP